MVLDQAIDTSTPAGRLLFNVLGSIAEFERDLIRERTRAGMAAARRRGKRIGRPHADVDRIALLRGVRAGASVSALARDLGVSRATTRGLLAELARDGGRALAERLPTSDAETAGATRGRTAA